MTKNVKIIVGKSDMNVLDKFENSKEMLDLGKDCWLFICKNKLQHSFWLWQAQKDLDKLNRS